jgi:glutamine synthetase type III
LGNKERIILQKVGRKPMEKSLETKVGILTVITNIYKNSNKIFFNIKGVIDITNKCRKAFHGGLFHNIKMNETIEQINYKIQAYRRYLIKCVVVVKMNCLISNQNVKLGFVIVDDKIQNKCIPILELDTCVWFGW